MNMISRDYVEKYVNSGESRHDEWVWNFLANAIGSEQKTLKNIKADLKEAILNDWRSGLAFYMDGSSYQGRLDVVSCKIAERRSV